LGKKIVSLLCLVLLLPGCSQLFPYDYPEAAPSPSPSPSPAPIVLPSPAPKANMFGIAYSPVSSFQPLTDTLRHNDHIARLCYEGLFELDETFTPQPLLCTAMETEDNITFRFTLREGVFFHDGSPLTAADVVYSAELARQEGNPYAARLACVAGVYAADGRTVTVEMNRAVWNAAALFDFPIVREVTSSVAPGTGPYRMTVSGEGNYLIASDTWWREKPLPVSRIDLVAAESADKLVYSFQYGYIAMLPADLWETFSPGISSGFEQVSFPSGIVQFIGINTGREPLDDPELRRALALALDRQGAIDAVYGADAVAAALPVPPASPFYSHPAAERYRRDPEAAAGIMASCAQAPELELVVSLENAARVQMAEAAAESFRAAGFVVTVRALIWQDFQQALSDGDFDLCYAEANPARNYDPREFFLPGGAFSFGGSEAILETAALLDTADPYAPDGSAALEALWDAVYGELPMLTVCFRNQKFLSQRGLLSGQTPTFANPYYRFADWTVTRE
jgi:peptide/nickel transport system substrate-binding protein